MDEKQKPPALMLIPVPGVQRCTKPCARNRTEKDADTRSDSRRFGLARPAKASTMTQGKLTFNTSIGSQLFPTSSWPGVPARIPRSEDLPNSDNTRTNKRDSSLSSIRQKTWTASRRWRNAPGSVMPTCGRSAGGFAAEDRPKIRAISQARRTMTHRTMKRNINIGNNHTTQLIAISARERESSVTA